MNQIPSLVTVVYQKKIKKITLLRYLCSKIHYEPDKVSQADCLALYDSLLWAQSKSNSDRGFKLIFGKNLELLSKILKNRRFNERVSITSFAKGVRTDLQQLTEFLYPERNYPTVKNRMSGSFHLAPARQPGKEKRFLPQPKFIGKGYGDKGTLRNKALDGSPTWQEIASSESYQIEIILKRLENDKTLEFREKLDLHKQVWQLMQQLKQSWIFARDRRDEKEAQS